ncbi:MAG TPA: Wzz/FepE/Etk N-terminal domain-containing protein [Chitinophagaceae bacterium]|nr:Wzz/FepE/Etk N-terminal domain-containing protein [Chitinophagaceae bacterium]
MADTILKDIIEKKWSILLFTGIATLLALVVSLVLPDEYVSQASLLPANSKLMDKQRLYENNIQELYSAYGNAEDLDRLFATMHSGAVIHHVADSLKLVEHYGYSSKKNAKSLAQKKLEKNIKLMRTEYGELRLRVWDEDAAMAEKIANALINRTQDVFDQMFRSFYERSLGALKGELLVRRNHADSVQVAGGRLQLAEIEKKIAEYEITGLNPPAAFFVMEQPSLSLIPDRPKIVLNVLITFLASLFTILAWIAAKRNMNV